MFLLLLPYQIRFSFLTAIMLPEKAFQGGSGEVPAKVSK